MKTLLILAALTTSAIASGTDTQQYSTDLNYAQVTDVMATQKSDGSWCFATSVRHNDEGWQHFANEWEVLDLQGNQLGVRPLAHPHVNEQPFTRSQCNIVIPAGMTSVMVRAKCNTHGHGGKPLVVQLKPRLNKENTF